MSAGLADAVAAPRSATIIDIDALERSKLARLDRIMRLALDALPLLACPSALRARHSARALTRASAG